MTRLNTVVCATLLAALTLAPRAFGAGQTIIVSAEGLADPQAETYQRDRGLMIEDLRKDAKRQIIEKAVGTLVETSTLVENYELISERVLTQSAALIKQVIKQSDPWIGEDGFAHMLMKAEVYLGDIRETLNSMSQQSRVALIKQHGNPRISVAVMVRNAARGPNANEERSDVAENILKEHIKGFGYRVWSDPLGTIASGRLDQSDTPLTAVDFRITGQARFDNVQLLLRASGLTVTKYKLTSWSVKCVDTSTGEEIYFNNQVPKHQTWSSEEEALADIGKLIGSEFSESFFQAHLVQPSRIYQLQVSGLPDYDSGKLLKKEMIGLRSVLNVDLRNFDAEGRTLMEVEFAGSAGNFTDLINASVIKPINAKLGKPVFKLMALEGQVVDVAYRGDMKGNELARTFATIPPASLAEATPQRIEQVVKSDTARAKVAAIRDGAADGQKVLKSIADF